MKNIILTSHLITRRIFVVVLTNYMVDLIIVCVCVCDISYNLQRCNLINKYCKLPPPTLGVKGDVRMCTYKM